MQGYRILKVEADESFNGLGAIENPLFLKAGLTTFKPERRLGVK